jgi:hypothetical protein
MPTYEDMSKSELIIEIKHRDNAIRSLLDINKHLEEELKKARTYHPFCEEPYE